MNRARARTAHNPHFSRQRACRSCPVWTRVNANFRIIKATEAVLIVLGLFLALYFAHPNTSAAVGLGLLVEAAVLLVFDAFAHERAHVYTEWLRSLGG